MTIFLLIIYIIIDPLSNKIYILMDLIMILEIVNIVGQKQIFYMVALYVIVLFSILISLFFVVLQSLI